MNTPFIQVLTTTEHKEDAERIATALLEKRLAACVQILGPMTSRYRWKGRIECAEEWFCQIKSRNELYPQLETVIRENHPYDVPEILALPVLDGNRAYLDWLSEETKK